MTEEYNFSRYSETEEGLIEEIKKLRAAEETLLEGNRELAEIAKRAVVADAHIKDLIAIIESDEVSRIALLANLHNQGFDPEESAKNQKIIEAAKAFLEG